MEDLKVVREKWFQAYLSGDIGTLRKIELPTFSFVSERGKESAVDRYTKIEHQSKSGNWFKPGATKEDIEISYRQEPPKCHVTGIGKITTNGHTISEVKFEELWVSSNDAWKIQSLHATSTL